MLRRSRRSADPFEMLGLSPNASIEQVRAARRALALQAHPDRGGDAARMTEINVAYESAIGAIAERRTSGPPRDEAVPESAPVPRRRGRDIRFGVEYDVPSFTMDALPAEAFEALLVVTSWIGEVLVDDPPYLLEVHLHEPSPCWCRIELVPDAGGSTVSLAVARVGDDQAPTAEEVRDTWVAHLNQLGSAS